jgi:flagellar basal-body rod modification protein FlgD
MAAAPVDNHNPVKLITLPDGNQEAIAMTVIGLDQVASRGGQTQTNQSEVMGKDEFLRLLVTQLQYQDPLSPMDSTGFTAQLAQFSSLEQLQNINSSIGTLETSQSIMTNGQAVGFIGKQITAIGDRISVAEGQSAPLRFNLESDAAGVYVKVYDMSGNFTRDIECGPMPAGPNSVDWDNLDYLAGQVPDGLYSFQVMAVDAEGNSVPSTTFSQGTVSGVNFKDGQAYLLTDEQEIPLGDVYQVLENNLD